MAKTAKPFRYRYGRGDLDERFKKFLDEACSMPLLTNDEVIAVAKKIKDGDIKSRDKLWLANMRFVVSVANRYQYQGLALKDLVMEGCLGLSEATKRFDETRGFTFITYAVWWIRQAILKALAEQSRIVGLPINRATIVSAVRKVSNSNELSQKYAGKVPAGAIARKTRLPLDEVEEAICMADNHLSLDVPNDDENMALGSLLEDETQPPPDVEVMENSVKEVLKKMLDSLTPRQAEVVDLYYGLSRSSPMNLKEIGDIDRVSREWIRQILVKAMRKLRHPSRLQLLKEIHFEGGKIEVCAPKKARVEVSVAPKVPSKPKDPRSSYFLRLDEMRQKAANTSAITFSRMSKFELQDWLISLKPTIMLLDPSLAKSLRQFYGLYGEIPRSFRVFKSNGNAMNENKEYALTALVRETGIEYHKLKAIFKKHLELISAH
ncbi:MAG: hypothetical protein COT26_00380 [Candidatus Kerfeldbacteria bacterium CG08_land_8_20_14_0_20_43_14]|uniref:RNA polymerase subunit sigma n=1 Tax=Candidatus Kerfeldbacteria bacterium CG08_land_8_20_14_0_20_43_14 TaxID=2014246 RepID=A0A2H0YRD6_9BACT|nr:MAG: hypothetical protein COT26_00380 [Candidatus Kerfeldbacteria bacterium CG08_land_8_20_14_0_20_43_14]